MSTTFINKTFVDINELNLFMSSHPELAINSQYELNNEIHVKFKLKSKWNGFKYQ